MKVDINRGGEDASFLHKLKSKLQLRHENEIILKAHEAKSKGIVLSEISVAESITIWSLLMEMVTWFIVNYVEEGKIKFKLWNLKKNLEAIIHVIRFFKKVMVMIED